MIQALRKFSTDEVARTFNRLRVIDEAKVASAKEDLARDVGTWKTLADGVRGAVEQLQATVEREIAQGKEVDFDRLIAEFSTNEKEENAARDKIERASLANIHKDILGSLNAAHALYLDLSRQVSQAYHDARWHFMELRARLDSSSPTGAIHGEATDLDELIKS